MDIGQTKCSTRRSWRRRRLGAPKYVSKGRNPMAKKTTKILSAIKMIE